MQDKTMERHIIVLRGFSNSGKSTVASSLQLYGYVRMSFAGILKDVCSVLFNWPREMLEGDTDASRTWRNTVDEWWARELGIPDFTPLFALIHIGTDVFRKHFNPSIWVLVLKNRIGNHEKIVIDDCRFPNELEFLKTLGNTQVVWVLRPETTPLWFCGTETCPKQAEALPESERSWIFCAPDNIICNTSSIESLKVNVPCVLGLKALPKNTTLAQDSQDSQENTGIVDMTTCIIDKLNHAHISAREWVRVAQWIDAYRVRLERCAQCDLLAYDTIEDCQGYGGKDEELCTSCAMWCDKCSRNYGIATTELHRTC